VEATCKPFDEVIHYLAEIVQYAVHYVFENLKMMSNTHMKAEIFDRNLNAAIGEQLSFALM
jgi:hypothetical protein